MDQNNSLKIGDIFTMISGFLKYYLSFRRLNSIIILTTITVSLLYYYIEKPKYQASASFILMESGGSKASGLASLGSQFGLDLGSLGGQSGSIFSGENIFDIFKTRSIIEKVLLTPYESGTKDNRTLADIYLTMNPGITRGVEIEGNLTSNYFFGYQPLLNSNRQKDSIMNALYEVMIKKNLLVDKLNKKGSIIQLSVISNNETFSKIFVERLLDEVRIFYLNIKNVNTEQALSNLQRKADSLQNKLYEKSFQSASLFNANNAIKSITANEELSQKDKTVTYTLYAEVIKNIEFAKLTQAQQSPIFQVLDLPRYPLENKKIKFSLLVLIGLLGGFFLSIVTAFLKQLFK